MSNIWSKVTNVFKKKEVVNAVSNQSFSDITATFIKQQLYRIEQEIGNWKNAVSIAESPYNPNRTLLYQQYKQIIDNPHLTAVRTNILAKVLGKTFAIKKKDGTKDEEKTDYLKNSKWFYNFRKNTVETRDYGHTLFQFFPIMNGDFSDMIVVPRPNVKPELHIVTDNFYSIEGNDYTQEPFSNYCVEIGDRHDLGMLRKATPWIIWIVNNAMFHAMYNEKFGTPFIVAKTDKTNKETSDNLFNAIRNFGNSSYLLMGIEDKLDFMTPSGANGETYLQFGEYCEKQISKLYLGSVGTTDEMAGGYAQSKVHQDINEEIANMVLKYVEMEITAKLLPFLAKHFGSDWADCRFEHDFEENVSVMEQFSMVSAVLNAGYDIDPEWFEKRFGFKIEKAPIADAPLQLPPNKKPTDSVLNFLKPQQ